MPLTRLCRAAVLANEGFLGHRDGGWVHHGDAVDVALLVMAHKTGVVQAETVNAFPELAAIPFESERQFCASLNDVDGARHAFLKGAPERLLALCDTMATCDGESELDRPLLEQQATRLASQGYRVIALAAGEIPLDPSASFGEESLTGLTLLVV